jgi:hypothetical protein
VRENIYDVGDGSRGGGDYIISRIDYQRRLRRYRDTHGQADDKAFGKAGKGAKQEATA